MELKLPIILLYSRGYSMTENGRTNEGVTCQYIITDNLDPQSTLYDKGIRATRGSIDLAEEKNIKSVPAMYEGTFTMKTGADGKAALKLLSVKYLKNVKLS